MDRATRVFGHDPLTVVELIVSGFLVFGGFYILTPFFDVSILLSHAPTAIKALGSTIGLAALGIVAVVTGAVHIWAALTYRYKIRAMAVFAQIMIRLYTIFAVIIAQGFFPMDWLNSLIIACILSVCYLSLKRKIRFFRDVE